jgi:amidohydrolase
MVKEGLFERCPMDMVFGMHNWPQLRAGTIAWRSGPIMAGAATIDITIAGKGSHGAFPHLGIDPIVIASHFVCSLQTIVARKIDPLDSAVVTIGQINSAGAVNVIPDTVRMLGTARWYDPRIGDQIEAGFVASQPVSLKASEPRRTLHSSTSVPRRSMMLMPQRSPGVPRPQWSGRHMSRRCCIQP